jgi:hypothetical protein
MILSDDLGREEGSKVGPEPGKGAVVHELSGEEDFDGLPGDVLPPKKEREPRAARKGRKDQNAPD